MRLPKLWTLLRHAAEMLRSREPEPAEPKPDAGASAAAETETAPEPAAAAPPPTIATAPQPSAAEELKRFIDAGIPRPLAVRGITRGLSLTQTKTLRIRELEAQLAEARKVITAIGGPLPDTHAQV